MNELEIYIYGANAQNTNPHFLAVLRFYRVDDKCLPVLLQVAEWVMLVVTLGNTFDFEHDKWCDKCQAKHESQLNRTAAYHEYCVWPFLDIAARFGRAIWSLI